MKIIFAFLYFCLLFNTAGAQTANKIENVIIVTTDGFRWQEVFKGMDSLIASDTNFNQKDSAGIFKKYWAETAEERRQKILPFIWTAIAKQGQLYGNRELGTKVNNANPYWFSYPGYNEIMTGFVDTAINTNAYPPNPNTNLLEFINKQNGFKGKVAAFCAWDAFDRILNEPRSGFPVVSGSDSCGGKTPDAEERMINAMKRDAYKPYGDEEAMDVFTHYAAMDYLKKRKPRAMYISYGETDEWAHAAHYKDYLNAAHQVDSWLNDIWSFIQNDSIYRNKTLLFVTVDHGRGENEKWTSHNSKIENSNQIWFAVIGPGILPKGEVKADIQLYQKQYAQTIAHLLGMSFTCEHPVADGFESALTK